VGILGSIFGAFKSVGETLIENAPDITKLVGLAGVVGGGGSAFRLLAGLPPVTQSPVRRPSETFLPADVTGIVPPSFTTGGFGPGRQFPTPGDVNMGLLGSSFLPQLAAGAGAIVRALPRLGGAVARQAPAALGGAAVAGLFDSGNGGDGGGMFRATASRVVPTRQLHAINPMTGNLETWLHAGRPTRWSRVNVRTRRHHHHPR